MKKKELRVGNRQPGFKPQTVTLVKSGHLSESLCLDLQNEGIAL